MIFRYLWMFKTYLSSSRILSVFGVISTRLQKYKNRNCYPYTKSSDTYILHRVVTSEKYTSLLLLLCMIFHYSGYEQDYLFSVSLVFIHFVHSPIEINTFFYYFSYTRRISNVPIFT